MAKIQAMVMRPTIFEVEAENFEKAKEIIPDRNSRNSRRER